MIRKIIICLAIVMMMAVSSCGGGNNAENEKPKHKRVLVVYFSATGKTKKVAQDIARIARGDLHEIIPAKPYTSADLDWTNEKSRSYVEMHGSDELPETTDSIVDISSYDVIFIGYPIWWDQAPRAINTFIDKQELGRRYVIPFATSNGSQIGESVDSLRSEYPGIYWDSGKLLNSASDAGLMKWISGFGIKYTK
ncbi:flavodoxin [uncultured Duncaniella sp.]|jgi:hypothetical protein|uniref:flavodoxin n=1 Tax=uncultured Duncaniella sp. TaxID=2768039 RepID=UPI0026744781|nr:flavodoxin [uncultured Duncaniella sp.]